MLRKAQKPVELYVRHHQLDRGDPTLVPSDWTAHPTRVGEFIRTGDSPDIRLDILDAAGQYRLPNQMQVDYHDFLAKLPDVPAPAKVWNHATENVLNRVYVQVHNRGTQRSSYLHVMLLLANLRNGIPALPADFAERIQNGQPIETAHWHTVGIFDLHGVQSDRPQIAAFDLSALALPHPDAVSAEDKYALIGLIHSFEDPFELDAAGALNLNDRKAAHKYIRTAPYVTEEPPAPPPNNILATYLVRPGDTLWAIAQRFYSNGRLWPHIYQHNRTLIGPNPNGLPKNVVIEIPVV
ncbi:MAG: LysM peptidoglycan-binding domain-containing protein [Caldilineaceae bacterium]